MRYIPKHSKTPTIILILPDNPNRRRQAPNKKPVDGYYVKPPATKARRASAVATYRPPRRNYPYSRVKKSVNTSELHRARSSSLFGILYEGWQVAGVGASAFIVPLPFSATARSSLILPSPRSSRLFGAKDRAVARINAQVSRIFLLPEKCASIISTMRQSRRLILFRLRECLRLLTNLQLTL